MILYLLSYVHQTCDRINVIMFISFLILFQFYIKSYHYHIMCTKRAFIVLLQFYCGSLLYFVLFLFHFIHISYLNDFSIKKIGFIRKNTKNASFDLLNLSSFHLRMTIKLILNRYMQKILIADRVRICTMDTNMGNYPPN